MVGLSPSAPAAVVELGPGTRVERAPEPHVGYNFGKRACDIVGAIFLMLLLSPVLIALGALIIVISGRPIFFVQRRIGLGGAEFACWKFRTMARDAEQRREEVLHLNLTEGPTLKVKDDPRVTKLGRFLRTTSLDELPQLWNVLIGDMSFVGPRPLPVSENRYRGEQVQRLSVKPGMTCIWQVSGRSGVAFDEWMKMDLSYVYNRTLLTDLWLLVRTIPAVLTARGAS